MKKGTHLINPKKQKCLCHRTTFYSIFIMSSYRKPDIQNDLLKLTKIKWIYQTVIKNVTMFISSCFNNYSTNFKKRWNKKSYASSGIRTRNPWALSLWNTCAIGCAKKTAENIFNYWYIIKYAHAYSNSLCPKSFVYCNSYLYSTPILSLYIHYYNM